MLPGTPGKKSLSFQNSDIGVAVGEPQLAPALADLPVQRIPADGAGGGYENRADSEAMEGKSTFVAGNVRDIDTRSLGNDACSFRKTLLEKRGIACSISLCGFC